MRFWLLIASLLLTQWARADVTVFAGGAFTTVTTSSQVTVPDVVGAADYATADTTLEGVGLDAGTETTVCSTATAGEILSQNPAAGLEVDTGTLVDLTSSTGNACAGRMNLGISIKPRAGLEL